MYVMTKLRHKLMIYYVQIPRGKCRRSLSDNTTTTTTVHVAMPYYRATVVLIVELTSTTYTRQQVQIPRGKYSSV